jgi:hypothetical protein
VASTEIQKLYQLFGDALFFENIRDFLGYSEKRSGRTTPNQEIVKTIRDSPDKMLQRNNGIVIRAENVSSGISSKQLIINRGSIVNGCQTTMCLVENSETTCYVPVKVVQTDDSWDVAKAANYQSSVEAIDLDLARHLRPQLAKRAASLSGIKLQEGPESALQIMDAIYDRKVAYQETKLLYIGIFSNKPNNLFSGNYTELNGDLINKMSQSDPFGESTFETLFLVQEAAQKGLRLAEATFTHASYAEKFKRLYKEDNPAYRCFISILALCGAVNTNLVEHSADKDGEYQRIKKYLDEAHRLLRNYPYEFMRYFVLSVKVWMQDQLSDDVDDVSILKNMSRQSQGANFTNMYRKLCMEADTDNQLQQMRASRLPG